MSLAVSTTGCGLFEEEGSATHKPGENCNECHGFTYAGTLYSDPAGTSAVSNATITISQPDGDLVMMSNSAGNFFTSAGNPSSGFIVSVTDGTNTLDKNNLVTNGGCSQSGCHTASGTGRVYIR